MHELREDLKKLIVECLELEDVTPDAIDDHAPLFGDGEGLGLDSIDALELAVALSKKYGVTIKAEDEGTEQIFSTVSTLAEHVAAHRTTPAASGS